MFIITTSISGKIANVFGRKNLKEALELAEKLHTSEMVKVSPDTFCNQIAKFASADFNHEVVVSSVEIS